MGKKDILIITGGNVEDDFAALWVKTHPFDMMIAADSGAEAAHRLGLKPDLLIGDFDSISPQLLDSLSQDLLDIRRFSCEKDATDTELAIEAALLSNPESISILGGTGSRLDHTFNTITGLVRAHEKGVAAFVYDRYNKIYVADGSVCIEKEKQYGDFVSLTVLSNEARISMSGFKYGLDNETVHRGSSLCQSNEIAEAKAYINVHDGLVIVFESTDGVKL